MTLFAKTKSFTHGRKRTGSFLKVIMLEKSILVCYLKYLCLLLFDLILLLELVLEMRMCISKVIFYSTAGSPQKLCLQQPTVLHRITWMFSSLGITLNWRYVARKTSKADRFLVDLFSKQRWDTLWKQIETETLCEVAGGLPEEPGMSKLSWLDVITALF